LWLEYRTKSQTPNIKYQIIPNNQNSKFQSTNSPTAVPVDLNTGKPKHVKRDDIIVKDI